MKRRVANEFAHESEEEGEETQNKELIIPLIKQNQWNPKRKNFGLILPENLYNKSEGKRVAAPEQVIPKMSAQEEALHLLKNSENLPILYQNKIPGLSSISSDIDRYHHDLDHRPDDIDDNSYKRVPIKDFGLAMLKGMGWKEGQAVGKNQNGLLAPLVFEPRPSQLGLGAEPAPLLKDVKKKRFLHTDEIKQPPIVEDVALPEPRKKIKQSEFKVGSKIKIIHGSKKGMTGKIVGLQQKDDGLVIKFESGNEIYKVWDDQIQIEVAKSWLRPHIRVRIISKSFKDGRYYNEKCIIQDVVSSEECIVKTTDGKVIDRVKQEYLETVVPKVEKQVMVLYSADRSLIGQLGKLIQYDSKAQKAVIQMDITFDIEVHDINLDLGL